MDQGYISNLAWENLLHRQLHIMPLLSRSSTRMQMSVATPLRQEDDRTIHKEVVFHTKDTGSWFLCISYALPSWRIPERWLRVPAWDRVALLGRPVFTSLVFLAFKVQKTDPSFWQIEAKAVQTPPWTPELAQVHVTDPASPPCPPKQRSKC